MFCRTLALAAFLGSLVWFDERPVFAAETPEPTLSFEEARKRGDSSKTLHGGISPHTLFAIMKAYANGRSSPPEKQRIHEDWELLKNEPYGMIALVKAQQLFFKWGARDHSEALEEASKFCDPQKGDVDLMAYAILGWSSTDPEGALNWVLEQSKKREAISERAIISLHQMALFGFVVAEREQEALTRWLEFYEGLDLEEFYEKMTDPAAMFAIGSLAKKDRDLALAWILEHSLQIKEERAKGMFEGVLISIAETDPREATLAAFTLPEGLLRESLFPRFIRWWSADDALAASAWLKKQEESHYKKLGAVEIMSNLAEKDIDEVKYWIEQAKDPLFRNALIYRSYVYFSSIDPAESVLILSLYDPSIPRNSETGFSGFGNAFAWLHALGQELVWWSAYQNEEAISYLGGIDFLDAEQSEILKEAFEMYLYGDYVKEFVGRLVERYGSVAESNGANGWVIASQALAMMNYLHMEKYDDALLSVSRAWGAYEPEVIRYLLTQQKLFGDEITKQALATLPDGGPASL